MFSVFKKSLDFITVISNDGDGSGRLKYSLNHDCGRVDIVFAIQNVMTPTVK